jgi:hypothetical protein
MHRKGSKYYSPYCESVGCRGYGRVPIHVTMRPGLAVAIEFVLTSPGAAETQRRALNTSPPLLRAWKSGALVAIRRRYHPLRRHDSRLAVRPSRVPPVVLRFKSQDAVVIAMITRN